MIPHGKKACGQRNKAESITYLAKNTRNMPEKRDELAGIYVIELSISSGGISTAYVGRRILSTGRSMGERMVMISLSGRHIAMDD
jgi:hypothetical protein